MRRILGVDFGRRRIGLAISDASGVLARPLRTIQVTATTATAEVVQQIEALAREEDGLSAVVVGVPRHLDGSRSDETTRVERFVTELRHRISIPVATEDERLSSREAEARLARHERDWRKRKAQLDAVAAAVVLQDYLDRTG